ncbi:MAG: hypothetical protein OXE52_01370 [Chloroflexi bacterium]|nr:hypothetical protein [Chloroflexota bacterium]
MVRRLNRLTTERSAMIILFLLIFAMASRVSVDTDLWWHLRSGQTSAETGQLIYPDPFSHTFTDVVHWNHSALVDLLLYAIWRHAGFTGITVATAIAAVAGMSFLFITCRGSAYPRAFLIVLGAATAAVFWSPRPQMLSFLFASVLLWILRDLKYNRRDRLLWILPLQMIWCNAHGGFIIGYLLIGAFVFGEVLNSKFAASGSPLPPQHIRKLLLLSAASIPLLALNPLGGRAYAVPFNTISMPELGRYIQEWQSPDFGQTRAWGFVILLALVLATMCCGKRNLDFTEWLLVCGSAAMGLLAARNLALFAIVAVPVASDHLDDILQSRGWVIPFRDFESPIRAVINLCLIILVSVAVGARLRYLLSADSINAGLKSTLPVDAVEQLDSLELQGNMFNSYNWGGYLMFHAPQYPVFIDGRSDLYRSFLDEYYRIATARDGWRQALDRWRIGFAVIETNSGLAEALASDQTWITAYQDPLASIFLRRIPLSNG